MAISKIIKQWYIYGLLCKDNSIYIGITVDVKKRVDTHRKKKGSKYVASRLPVKILGYYECKNRSEATQIECYLKKLPKEIKKAYFKI